MPLHPNISRCTHIQVTGHRCGSPALKHEYFCYFHTRMIKGVQSRVDSQIHPIALIENAEAIQSAIMHMIDALLKGTIDTKRANLILKALHIAVRNCRNVRFYTGTNDMVSEVPNYAEQYLSEHPEPKECHPERARPLRESKDPHPADGENAAAGSSPHSSQTNREKDSSENISPLTNHQTESWDEIKKLEASLEGAMRGNWRDLRTVFIAVGLTPPKPPTSHRAPPRKKVRGG